jgi:putative CocE/NonD family hydrolase
MRWTRAWQLQGRIDRMPETFSVVVDKNVPMTTRDGTVLRSDVYRPIGDGRHPVLLGRTQYNKETWGGWISPANTAATGYVVVVNDMRGQFASDGEFDPFVFDVEDSYDVVEWCAAQPWSDGKVGMYGSSSCGFVQLQAAVSQPPHLVAIAPKQTWSSFGRGCVYDSGGAYSMYTQEWTLMQTSIDARRRIGQDRTDFAARRQSTNRALWEISRWHQHLPLGELPPLDREHAPYYYRWLEHPDHDDFWATRNITAQYDRILTPALHLVGWFDRFSITSVRNYLGIKQHGGTEAARQNQRLVIGPWPHGVPVAEACGEHHFGPAAAVDVRALMLRWYGHWLKGEATGLLEEPPVRVFVLGENAWRDAADWPLPGTTATTYYLRGGGRANTLDGDGALSRQPPAKDESADSYTYDPADPTPSVAGRDLRFAGPFDQRPIERRPDVLVFSTPPLERDTVLIGSVYARLWAASSAPDTDWVVKLVDVAPDGYAFPLSIGMLRARYRESQTMQKLLEPGRVYEYDIELRPVGNCFMAGHRIRLEVASASFAEFDRNMNTGNAFGCDQVGQPATQLIFHDASRPSHIVLPVVQ